MVPPFLTVKFQQLALQTRQIYHRPTLPHSTFAPLTECYAALSYVLRCCKIMALQAFLTSNTIFVYPVDVQDRRFFSSIGLELQSLQAKGHAVPLAVETHITAASRQLRALTR
jgi:hypothetical protein